MESLWIAMQHAHHGTSLEPMADELVTDDPMAVMADEPMGDEPMADELMADMIEYIGHR
jgi:hypothetical protein